MSDAKELAAILIAIVLAFGLLAGAVMLQESTSAALILLCAAIAFGGTAALGAFMMLNRTKPLDRRHF